MTIPQDRANRGDPFDITRPKDRHDVGAEKEQIVVNPRHSTAAAGLVVLSILVTACGGTASLSAGTAPSLTSKPAASPAATTSATAAPSAVSTPVASPAPALKLLWEKAGDTPPKGHDPATYWPAIDPLTGNIWVALGANGLYWIFSPDGKYLGSFGEPGTGPGQFNFQRTPCPDCVAGAIAFAPDGSFVVADDGNNRIQKFDAAHKFVKAWGSFGSGDGQFADANAIATDGRQVYVYDDVRLDVQVFDTEGKLLRKMTNLWGWITLDKAGNLWAPNDAGLVEFDATGKQVKAYALPNMGDRVSLVIDATGRLYFNLQDDTTHASLGLVRFDPATNSLDRFSTSGETLAIDPAHNAIYEANFVSPGWPAPVLRKYTLPAK
jgi:DNA-binding beta-propeller fold protein YncE